MKRRVDELEGGQGTGNKRRRTSGDGVNPHVNPRVNIHGMTQVEASPERHS